MNKDYSKVKKIMLGIGIPLLVIGIILAVLGFSSFIGSFGEESINKSSNAMSYFVIGGFLIVIGFGLVGLSLLRRYTSYVATETSPAIATASQAFGKGVMGGSKEVVKIKCPNCGYLESEDAEFCSKCGKKM